MAEEKGASIEMDTVRPPQEELRMTLYMLQISDGPKRNQQVAVSPYEISGFGRIVANDWPVFDEKDNLVGNAQGMHIGCCQTRTHTYFNIYFDLVFKHGRFKGSALKLLGTYGPEREGEWAIVGGTGQFTLAQGVIAYSVMQDSGGKCTKELKFRVFYTTLREVDTVRLPQKELCMTLYVHQVWSGPKKNQEVVAVPPDKSEFGRITANDWTVFDGIGSGANLVGNAQGMHLGGCNTIGPMAWNIYFDLVFKDGSFKGSSLKLLGTYGPPREGEWAIVGGTGQLTLAQGVIAYRSVQDGGGMCIMELKCRVFYATLSEIDTVRLPQKELCTTLYVHQSRSARKNYQVVVVVPKDKTSDFGRIAINDWTVFDEKENLVGNTQGMHMGGCKTTGPMTWNIYFDLVFKDGRFEGSSLMLLGTYGPPEEGEWAIVGGTGEFTLAQGVIAYRIVQDDGDMCMRELKLRVFYTTLKA